MRTALPARFLTQMRRLLGGEYADYLASFDVPVQSGLRVNTWKWTPRQAAAALGLPDDPVPWTSDGFYIGAGVRGAESGRWSKDPYYHAGLYYLQEPSAMAPAAFLPVEPGERVLDLCAAPGGKSTELGARLRGTGLLFANDISSSRAKGLLKNLELFGLPNICVASETPERLSEVYPAYFDKILVDAPCSGEGMFRRDPDMVKDWLERGPAYYAPLQRQILECAVKMLRPGGFLLYSTCTFSEMEDEGMVRELLADHGEMELVPVGPVAGAGKGIGLSGCLRLYPHKVRGEGHFLALMRKKGGVRSGDAPQTPVGPAGTELRASAGPAGTELRASVGPAGTELRAPAGLAGTGRQSLTGRKPSAGPPGGARRIPAPRTDAVPELTDFLSRCRCSWDPGRFMQNGGSIYYLPEHFVPAAGVHYLRTGLLLGTLKKGHFEPSQALALFLNSDTFDRAISFAHDDERVIRYLKGETIFLKESEPESEGWCLICVDGFGLGFAKGNGRTLKNKYYPGWRWT